MKIIKVVFVLVFINLLYSCASKSKKNELISEKSELLDVEKRDSKMVNIDDQITFINSQLSLLLQDAERADNIPRTVEHNEVKWVNPGFDWTEGFFPGTCWYLYEATKDKKWKNAAEKFQSKFEAHQVYTSNHDLGFVFNSSYGNGLRLTNNEGYSKVLVTAADALSKRFNSKVGCIKSWDVDEGWQSKRDWQYPVIIDNMMNLELLFKASELTGDTTYSEMAKKHANTTLKNHYRADNSSVHVVDYNPNTGEVRSKQTAQGYANESSWARGQAWGLYGFTVCYRFTGDEKYLNQAIKIADYIINYKDLSEDGVPYWDYNAPNLPDEPRDVSASAVTLSALIELNQYTDNTYKTFVDKTMNSLASPQYMAKLGENHHFVLKHSVGSIPHQSEIDVPLIYADYYYLEALLRYKNFNL
ncbi:glycoside hydrolase family 88 protein [Algibacter mikhailovii]|uniref:Glucuronyl hydrolase n=1 Tax=Algibacter mikhailovii TaxID=425498 RepID=A0A918R3J6_9FLAO|nr:glycoside hydrolase family 88 protein [Algibacter mikhailovii]GGZ81769.1 glucuronyl hydrolase [Algibacter mikhailovii]